ncbi:MAG: hypothetical protein PVH19_01375 [Planctomycetia bacterium]|jgi:hypothetical protein
MNRTICIILGMAFLIAGCVGGEPEPLPPELKAKKAAEEKAAQEAEAARLAKEKAEQEARNRPPQVVNTEKYQGRMGAQGTGYGGTEPIGTAISAYFGGKEQITQNQLTKAMTEFKAFNDNRTPKDAKEFEEKILVPYGIQLPELPPGKQYYYDPDFYGPKKGELTVQTLQ